MIPIAAASTLALIALTPGPGLLLGFTELVVTVLAGTPEFIESRHELLFAGDLRHGKRGFLGPRQRRLEGGMISPISGKARVLMPWPGPLPSGNSALAAPSLS